jgi:hypothetical protein
MANVNRPGGLKPVSYLNGAPYNGQARLYYRGTGDANAIYVGDPVTLGGTADAKGLADVVLGTAGSAIVGVVIGVVVVTAGVSLVGSPSVDLTIRSLAASTAGYLLVADDPMIVFEIQDGVVAGTALTDIGSNVNFLIAAGATTYSDSGTTTAVAITGTTTANLKLLGFVQRDDNVVASQYAKLLVKINNHVYAASTGTAVI